MPSPSPLLYSITPSSILGRRLDPSTENDYENADADEVEHSITPSLHHSITPRLTSERRAGTSAATRRGAGHFTGKFPI
jgi:hypothetical protein